MIPERLNLAIARRCDIACDGCYTFFGQSEPDLHAFLLSAGAFVRLGLSDVTISGGDPLTIADLMNFLNDLKLVGMQSIKLDTVGVGLTSPLGRSGVSLEDLLERVDFLGIPLDGWSDDSVRRFRRGRDQLYTETIALLDAIENLGGAPKVIINTVAHRNNFGLLKRVLDDLRKYACVCHWNIFQYTPTDQADVRANAVYALNDRRFGDCQAHIASRNLALGRMGASFPVEFRSTRSRLGQYLLVNSDGQAWLPDESGRTVRLGSIFGREGKVLSEWAQTIAGLTPRLARSLQDTM